MAENTKLYEAIQGLHETDSKIWSKTQEVSGAVVAVSNTAETLSNSIGISNMPNNVSAVVDADNKINDDLLPSVLYKGKGDLETNKMGSSIKFIGNCAVRQDSDGNLIIRIGDNLNSSNFSTTDGQTTGVNDTAITSPTGTAGKLSGGTDVTAITGGDYTIKTKTAGNLMHFADNESTFFEIKCTDDNVAKIYHFGPVNLTPTSTGASMVLSAFYATDPKLSGVATAGAKMFDTYNLLSASEVISADISGFYLFKDTQKFWDGSNWSNVDKLSNSTLKVYNFKEETKKSEGAEGYCGSISATISAADIANCVSGETSTIALNSITHYNGSEGSFSDTNLGTTTRYFYTDTTTKPTITANSAKVTITKSSSKIVSGVKYITSGTAKYDVSFTNIANPVHVASNVVFDNSGWAEDKTVTAGVKDTSATATGALLAGTFSKDTVGNKITVTVKNINGSGTAATIDLNESLLIDTLTTADDALNAYFNIEDSTDYPRLNLDLSKFNNKKFIGETDLMLSGGCLIYPVANLSGYNTDIASSDLLGSDGETSVTTNPNYSTLSGTRYWYRKFYQSGDKNGATLSFTTKDNFDESKFSTNMIVEIGVLKADGTVKKWYDATKKSTESTTGIRTDNNKGNDKTPTLTVDWGSDGAASNGIIIKLGLLEKSTVKVDTLTVAFA
jgi:hypothetical protein